VGHSVRLTILFTGMFLVGLLLGLQLPERFCRMEGAR